MRKTITINIKTYTKLLEVKHSLEKQQTKVLNFDEVISFLLHFYLNNKK